MHVFIVPMRMLHDSAYAGEEVTNPESSITKRAFRSCTLKKGRARREWEWNIEMQDSLALGLCPP